MVAMPKEVNRILSQLPEFEDAPVVTTTLASSRGKKQIDPIFIDDETAYKLEQENK